MKQFLLVLKVIFSNWKKAKVQLIFTILGIAIASTLWSSIDIVNNQTIKAQKRSIDLLQTAFKPIIIDKELLRRNDPVIIGSNPRKIELHTNLKPKVTFEEMLYKCITYKLNNY